MMNATMATPASRKYTYSRKETDLARKEKEKLSGRIPFGMGNHSLAFTVVARPILQLSVPLDQGMYSHSDSIM